MIKTTFDSYKVELISWYRNSFRKFYFVRIINTESGEDYIIPFYMSSGQNEKGGQTWGGCVFPTLGVIGVETPEIVTVRNWIYGEGDNEDQGWICKSPWFESEPGRFFGAKILRDISLWLQREGDNCQSNGRISHEEAWTEEMKKGVSKGMVILLDFMKRRYEERKDK